MKTKRNIMAVENGYRCESKIYESNKYIKKFSTSDKIKTRY